MSDLYCFNPITGKRDGKYCVWEGAGKCMKCEAVEELQALVERMLTHCFDERGEMTSAEIDEWHEQAIKTLEAGDD